MLFADKTTVVVSARTYEQLNYKINKTYLQLQQWFTSNGLILNAEKSNLILFSARPQAAPLTVNSPVPLCDECRFLGLTLDSNVNWKSHVQTLCSKLSSAAYALRKLRPLISHKILKQVYFAHFHSVMSYGVILWGNSTDSHRAFILQKRALRIIDEAKPRTSCRSVFKKHSIMTIYSLYIFEVLKYVREHLVSFSRCSGGGKQLRSAGKLEPVQRRTKLATKNPRVIGPTFYEKLPAHLKNETNDETFYRLLRNFLLDNEYYTIDEFLMSKK